MAFERVDLAAGVEVPELESLVPTARQRLASVWRDRDRSNGFAVPLQGPDLPTIGNVPMPDCAVLAARDRARAVGCDCHRADAAKPSANPPGVSLQRANQWDVVGDPDSHSELVERGYDPVEIGHRQDVAVLIGRRDRLHVDVIAVDRDEHAQLVSAASFVLDPVGPQRSASPDDNGSARVFERLEYLVLELLTSDDLDVPPDREAH